MDLVDDFFSGPITVSWRKLRGYFEGERELKRGKVTDDRMYLAPGDRVRIC
jgi:hypothetical protein